MKKPLVIKIGGTILEKKESLISLLKEIAVLKSTYKQNQIVLVHGGGCVVDDMLAQASFMTTKKNGLRITPKEQIGLISGTLAGTVNKAIVATANSLKINSVGLSLVDGQIIQCEKSTLGLDEVGDPSPNKYELLSLLLTANFLPIISSIGALDNGDIVNVNADDAAVAICQLLNAELLLLTDVNGVKGQNGEYLKSLNNKQAETLIKDGIIAGGMTAKVNAALRAANQLRRSIAVASWQLPKQISLLIAGHGIGTQIQPN